MAVHRAVKKIRVTPCRPLRCYYEFTTKTVTVA